MVEPRQKIPRAAYYSRCDTFTITSLFDLAWCFWVVNKKGQGNLFPRPLLGSFIYPEAYAVILQNASSWRTPTSKPLFSQLRIIDQSVVVAMNHSRTVSGLQCRPVYISS